MFIEGKDDNEQFDEIDDYGGYFGCQQCVDVGFCSEYCYYGRYGFGIVEF